MSWSAKCKLVDQIVDFSAQLFRLGAPPMGNTYRSTDTADIPNDLECPATPKNRVGRIVSMPFFWNDHLSLNIPRGPFSTSREWLAASLAIKKYDCDRIAQRIAQEKLTGALDEDDDDDDDDNEFARVLIEQLTQLLPKLFPRTDDHLEDFALRHDDIYEQNILVDAPGQLTALVDWECVSYVPFWKACQIPHLLVGQDRFEEPHSEGYSRNEDGSPDELYFEHLKEFQLTKLREYFLKKMAFVEPSWMDVYNASEAKADFGWAVENSDDEFCLGKIRKWLDGVDAGISQPSLRYSIANS